MSDEFETEEKSRAGAEDSGMVGRPYCNIRVGSVSIREQASSSSSSSPRGEDDEDDEDDEEEDEEEYAPRSSNSERVREEGSVEGERWEWWVEGWERGERGLRWEVEVRGVREDVERVGVDRVGVERVRVGVERLEVREVEVREVEVRREEEEGDWPG